MTLRYFKINRAKRYWVFLLMLSVLFISVMLLGSRPLAYAQDGGPNVLAGKLLSEDWSFHDGPPLELSGDWEVIWGEPVPPETFDARYQGELFSLPGRWNKVDRPGMDGPFGSATFRSTLALPTYNRDLSYHLIAPHSAYTVYIDGVLALRNGPVSETADAAG